MSTEPKPFELGSLDDYLNRICEAIQLTETQFNTAVKRYERVGEWLLETETHLEVLSPKVFPQGSMLQRTTIRPTRNGSEVVPFDLDSICRCTFDPHTKTSQSLYGSVLARLNQNEDFAKRMQDARKEHGTSGKCIKLAYLDDDFYLDVVPMCIDPTDADGVRLLMCDPGKWTDYKSPIETWRRTDPFRFSAWLENRCRIVRLIVEKFAANSAAPVPPRESVDRKAPLRRVIQLLKRQRDRDFLGDDCRPTSILLTTLAGRHYRGEASIADALERVLDGIAQQISEAHPRRITVLNPADEMAPHDGGAEDLAAPLDDASYEKFCRMIEKMRKALAEARAARGVPKLFPVLAEAYGERIVKKAFNSAEEEVKRANTAGLIGATVGSSQIKVLDRPKAVGSVQPVRRSDFHRND